MISQELKDVGLRAHFTDVNEKRVWHARQTFDLVNFFGHDAFLLWPAAGADFGGYLRFEKLNWYPFSINFKKKGINFKKVKIYARINEV